MSARQLLAAGMTCGLTVCPTILAAPPLPNEIVIFHDNGLPDGVNAYSNATRFVFGARRTLLDDFLVTDPSWTINGMWHRGIWDTLPPGSGLGMEITFRMDADGTPGDVIGGAMVTGYAEHATGNIHFSREEYRAWVSFADITLPSGRYWFEATTLGPENNFWLTAPVLNEECWVDYEDVFGLVPASELFGRAADLNWQLFGGLCAKGTDCCRPDGSCDFVASCAECLESGGEPLLACEGCLFVCVGDIDSTNTVDFGDILAILSEWGPCDLACPADLDGDRVVGFTDLLIVLAAWGPCDEV